MSKLEHFGFQLDFYGRKYRTKMRDDFIELLQGFAAIHVKGDTSSDGVDAFAPLNRPIVLSPREHAAPPYQMPIYLQPGVPAKDT
eukprot:CAMPEP_0119328884 /NCGR_PEP_ID=MMETSP1333-20130426/74514_1 /TAXON_ID=418940 /ORGANISM="Scyphosphaera apsteinii, Strain RCC1455" /LENGTH=84 /DNA_ID=CAMNT_0007337873 /DNA_START=13 /DNA_END=267 /DNA_ORIENTATION=-